MKPSNGKFLVELVHSLTDRQLFFLFWGAIVVGFVLLMLSYQKKTNRRNFRSPQDGPGPKVRVDARQVGSGNAKPPAKRN